jgi:hypothetical protein
MIASAAVRWSGVISSSGISLNRLSSLCAAADPARTNSVMMQTPDRNFMIDPPMAIRSMRKHNTQAMLV